MRIRSIAMDRIISLERVVLIEFDEDEETQTEELNPGHYAMDSDGCLWKRH